MTPTLFISPAAVRHNYQLFAARLSQLGGRKESVAAVLKADGYGLGAHKFAPVLAGAGCRTFYTATIDEGIALRQHLTGFADVAIHPLEGFGAVGNANPPVAACVTHNVMPVINQPTDVAAAVAVLEQAGAAGRIVLHIDTGMHRLGFPSVTELFGALDTLAAAASSPLHVTIMSHFACADTPDHADNARQIGDFAQIRRDISHRYGGRAGMALEFVLANSAGLWLDYAGHANGGGFPFDGVRAGVSLYGIDPSQGRSGGRSGLPSLRSAVRMWAPVHQWLRVKAGDTVSYGGVWQAKRDSWIATLRVGYADGLPRRASGKLYAGWEHAGEVRLCPQIGRITMDFLMIDATDFIATDATAPGAVGAPPAVAAPPPPVGAVGAVGGVVLVDDRIPELSLAHIAHAAGDIPYAILTGLRQFRGARCYSDSGGDDGGG